MLKRARAHKGTSFVEIYQNCAVFNDGAFAGSPARGAPADATIWFSHGEPMLFAKGTKGLRLDRDQLRLEVVDVADGDWEAAGVLVHDETSRTIAHLLIDMPAAFPHRARRAFTAIRRSPSTRPSPPRTQKVAASKKPNLQKLLSSGETWSVAANGSGACA